MSTGKVKPIHIQQKPRITCRHRNNLSSCWHLVIRVRTYQLLKLRFGVYVHSVTYTKEKEKTQPQSYSNGYESTSRPHLWKILYFVID